MAPPKLRTRIRNGTLAMLAIALLLGGLALPKVHQMGGAIREMLYRNYLSIEAASHMHHALWILQIAVRDGSVPEVLPRSKPEFRRWIDIEEHDISEQGEGELAREIHQRAERLMAEAAQVPAGDRQLDPEFERLHQLLDRLAAINRDAMFRADSRSARLSTRLTYEFAAGLIALLLLGSVLAWTLAAAIARPLSELADRLRSFSLNGPASRLGPQPLAELQSVAEEFNRMAERLEQFERLNVDRIIYEKSKTEAIIESLEDGIVLIDPDGIVTHINEVAAIILGIERPEALGRPFDDLDTNHPHYRRVRAALDGGIRRASAEAQRVEVALHVRGREHSYVLKPVPLRQADGRFFGTILNLQDITYLRDKDRARTNLVATLSHEIKTPLTSLALAVELLARDRSQLGPKQQELVESSTQDVGRLRLLADNLLTLARGDIAAITLAESAIDLSVLASAIVKNFALQAEQRKVHLVLDSNTGPATVRGDAIKLSWVISNLVANALRYTPEGGTITLRAERLDKYVRLTVSDTGPGIPAAIREHLFERFAQGNVNGAEAGSAGLGLAIVREIVEAHGGRIFVASDVGRGAAFTVSLPASTGDAWAAS